MKVKFDQSTPQYMKQTMFFSLSATAGVNHHVCLWNPYVISKPVGVRSLWFAVLWSFLSSGLLCSLWKKRRWTLHDQIQAKVHLYNWELFLKTFHGQSLFLFFLNIFVVLVNKCFSRPLFLQIGQYACIIRLFSLLWKRCWIGIERSPFFSS